MNNVFFFGSLMDKELLEIVLDRAVDNNDRVLASMYGVFRSRADDEKFPVLVECEESKVNGILTTNLTNSDINRLKFFATNMRLKPTGHYWDFDSWLENDKQESIDLTNEIMKEYGKLDVSEIESMWYSIKRDVSQKYG